MNQNQMNQNQMNQNQMNQNQMNQNQMNQNQMNQNQMNQNQMNQNQMNQNQMNQNQMNQNENSSSATFRFQPLVSRIKTLAASERKITAEVVDCIRVIEIQRVHVAMGYSSVLEFLVRECGYSETSALRRMDAARLLKVLPEVREDLQTGSLNLSQVSMVAQSVRQKEKLGVKVSVEKKKELVAAVKNKKAYETQKIAAQMLELPILQQEKKRVQADESVRLEMSLSKEEMGILNRAREILGHVRPGMSMKELFVLLAERFVKAKDPAREVRPKKSRAGSCEAKEILEPLRKNVEWQNEVSQTEQHLEARLLSQRPDGQIQEMGVDKNATEGEEIQSKIGNDNGDNSDRSSAPVRSRVRAAAKRFVFQRDRVCQWTDPVTKRKCGSRHLLEVDHRMPKWAGGGDGVENLELKCRAHNQWKYLGESGRGVNGEAFGDLEI